MNVPTFTILVVEDFAADRELYRRALDRDTSCKYQLLETESVAVGLELCKTRSIDAILLDYQLRDGNGLDFLADLAVQSNGRMPPAIMMTGQGNENTAVSAMKLGAEDYLVKRDLTPELLQLKVRRAILQGRGYANEHARLRQQQQQQERRFRASVENMLDCVGIYSAIRDAAGQLVDFRFDYLNAAAMRSNRMTEADMSRTLCEVFPAIRETGLMAEYDRVIETGIPLVKEDIVYTDVYGGERLTIAYHMQVAKLDDGMVIAWREITERKQAELNLQAANRQMTTIWESMTDAYAMLDRDWRVVYTNPAATEVYRQTTGLVPAEYLGRSHWEVFPATVGTVVEREYRRAVTEAVAVHFELFYEPTETWFEVHAYPSAEGLGIYFRDINQRKLDELARAAAERERDRFFELSIDLLVVANFDGYFVRVNPACERILGFTSAEMMAQPFLDFVHPDDRAATMAAVGDLSGGNAIINFENRYRCQDGSYRWLLWSALPDADCNLIYASGHDITDRKVAELNDKFLYELMQRLRQLSDAEEIQAAAVKSLGEYLDVDRATWFEVDLERGLATIDRDWYRDGLASHAGVYPIADFILPAARSALSAGNSVVIADVTTDPVTAPQVATYRQLSIGAFVNIPCVEEGRWVAALNLNTTTARNWRADEVELCQAVVTQLWSLVAQARGVAALRAQERQTQAARAIVEQQLREIEAIYRAAPIGLAFISNDLKFVRINELLAHIGGASVAEHIGQTIRHILPEMADILEPLYRQVIESGEPILDLELTGTTPAQPGVERHWLAAYCPQTDVSGRTIGVNVMVQEITERKRMEAARLAAEQERDRFFDLSIDLLAIGNFDGYFTRLNPSWERVLGYTNAELMAQPFIEFVHPDDRHKLEVVMQGDAKAGLLSTNFENRYRCKDGSYRWLSWSTMPYPQQNLLYGIARDVTQSKQNQADLENRNRELDSFVFVVSHDLKAPLRAVANLSQWIEEDLEGQLTDSTRFSNGDALRTQMTQLRERVARMAATIDGLLEYARIGRDEDTIEPVALARLLAEVIDSLAPPPTFTIDLPAELPTFNTKRLPLFQILVNLIGNGIKHHHSEAGSIQISIVERGDWYEFGVSDDGSGIAPENQERMFKIFQAVNPQKRSDSTGIGLAIVKKIIEAEGGTIRLESELGRGTTFYFTWPKR